MPSQRALAGLVAVLAAALVLLSAVFLSRERERALSSAPLPPARPRIAEAEPASAEPLRMVAEEDAEEPARTGRVELLPFDADRPETVVAPPLSDPARTWEQERDARRELATRSIALLLRDGTTPTASAAARAPSGAGGGRVLVARAREIETPRLPPDSIVPGRTGRFRGHTKVGPAAPRPHRSAPARKDGSRRGTCP